MMLTFGLDPGRMSRVGDLILARPRPSSAPRNSPLCEHQATNLGVRSSNLFGRATKLAILSTCDGGRKLMFEVAILCPHYVRKIAPATRAAQRDRAADRAEPALGGFSSQAASPCLVSTCANPASAQPLTSLVRDSIAASSKASEIGGLASCWRLRTNMLH